MPGPIGYGLSMFQGPVTGDTATVVDPDQQAVMDLLSQLILAPPPEAPTAPAPAKGFLQHLEAFRSHLHGRPSLPEALYQRQVEDYNRRAEENDRANRTLINQVILSQAGKVGRKAVTPQKTEFESPGPDGMPHKYVTYTHPDNGQMIGKPVDLGPVWKAPATPTKPEKPVWQKGVDESGEQIWMGPPDAQNPTGRIIRTGVKVPVKPPPPKSLDAATRGLLVDAKTGSDFAREALAFFETTGANAGGPVAGRLPTWMLPTDTKKFNTLRVKAEAQLRKYMAGSAVTPTEMLALEPLLVGLTGTPEEIRNSMSGIADFFDKKRVSVLNTLEASGYSPDVIQKIRAEFGPATGGVPTPPGGPESEDDKIRRLREQIGVQ